MARPLLVFAILVGMAGTSPATGRSRVDRVRRHLANLVASERSPAPAGTMRPRNAAPRGAAVTYYVDAQGNNTNPGTSPDRAWSSIARANRGRYGAGDAILFRGGQTFRGALRFTPLNAVGTAAAPITIGSFGDGRATLDGRRRSTIVARNVAGFHITNLNLVGARHRACHGASHGILFEAGGTNTTLSHIAIDHVEVSGFCEGITVGTDDDVSKFDDVRITDVVVHDNGDAGINTFDPALAHHDVSNVYVARAVAHDNADTGGIVLFGVNGGTVEDSVAYHNGFAGSGSVGIWAFDATGITIQRNESYDNRTIADDGDGFDLDGGVSNSVIQYNYSHDNDGIGYLVCACVDFYEMHHDVVRYNVSENDGRSGQPSGLFVLGGEVFGGLDVYANTIYSRAGDGELVRIDGGGSPYAHVHVRNNVLVSDAGKVLLVAPDPEKATDLALQGNDWWPRDGAFEIDWGSMSYPTLDAWRTASGQEQVGARPVGMSVDPEVCDLGHGGTVSPAPLPSLTAYRLRPGSPLVDTGLDLPGLFGVDVAGRDFSGDPVPAGRGFDVGADELQPGQTCP